MRNIIFGMIGAIMIGYSTLICLSIYGIQLREHEMESRISQIAAANLEAYYVPEFLREEGFEEKLPKEEEKVKTQINQELERCSTLKSSILPREILVDLKRGLIHLSVEETYGIPTGKTMTRTYERTVIMERREGGYAK